MPSPVGHALIGLAIGLAARPRRGAADTLRRDGPWLAAAVVLANLPDLDYLPGVFTGRLNAFHHGYTHTLGWAVLATAAVALAVRAWRGSRMRAASVAVVFALLASHLVADWLTEDRRPPYGIMALWPLDDTFRIAPVTPFLHLRKADYAEFLQPHNFAAVGVEALWCLPLVAAAWLARRRPPVHPP